MVTFRALVVLLLTGLLAPLPSLATGATAQAATASQERYVAFRTADTGQTPPARYTRACTDRLAPAAGVIPIELYADLFSFTTQASTGLVRDETRRRLGPGYLCIVSADPTGASSQLAAGGQAYAELRMPGLGRVSAAGFCALLPAFAQPGAIFANCRLEIDPDPALGLIGGVVTSNSIANPAQVPGNPTGSIWTASVVRTSWPAVRPNVPLVPGTTTAEGGTPETFVVARGRHGTNPGDWTCAGGTANSMDLVRAQPAERTGVLPAASGTRLVGQLLTCVPNLDGGDVSQLQGQIRVAGPDGDPVRANLQGRCLVQGQPPRERRLICALQVLPAPQSGIVGGLVTTIGPADVPVTEAGPGDTPLVTVAFIAGPV